MKIKINKIFNKYDAVYDTNENCTIYIGENGIGKTTILKILNSVIKGDFVEILNYNFQSIEFIFESKSYKVNYEDFSLPYEYIIKLCKLNMLMSTNKTTENISDQDDVDPYLYGIYNFLVNNEDKYVKILKHLLANEVLDKEIIEYIKGYFKDSFGDKIFYSELESLLEDNQYKILFPARLRLSNFNKNTELIKLLEDYHKDYHINKSLFLNMASEYEVINILDDIGVRNSLETDLFIYDNKYVNKRPWSKSIVHRQGCFSDFIKDEGVELLKKMYKKLEFDIDMELETIMNNKKINLANVFFELSITKEMVIEFKELYYSYIEKHIKEPKKSYEDYLEYYPIEDQFIIENYLMPLIPKRGFFYEMTYNNRYNFYLEFKSKLYDKIKNNLSVINNLFDKYITNKKVVATPNGLVISLNTKKLSSDLEYESLSAGEKKLVIIFTSCVFFEDINLCLDEPENSLSIVWQKNIINDIVNNSKSTSLIVATQAPYIISDETLEDNVVYLPFGDENE